MMTPPTMILMDFVNMIIRLKYGRQTMEELRFDSLPEMEHFIEQEML